MGKNWSAFALMTDMRPSGCLVKWRVIDCTFPGWRSRRGVTHRGCSELSHTFRCTRKEKCLSRLYCDLYLFLSVFISKDARSSEIKNAILA